MQDDSDSEMADSRRNSVSVRSSHDKRRRSLYRRGSNMSEYVSFVLIFGLALTRFAELAS